MYFLLKIKFSPLWTILKLKLGNNCRDWNLATFTTAPSHGNLFFDLLWHLIRATSKLFESFFSYFFLEDFISEYFWYKILTIYLHPLKILKDVWHFIFTYLFLLCLRLTYINKLNEKKRNVSIRFLSLPAVRD